MELNFILSELPRNVVDILWFFNTKGFLSPGGKAAPHTPIGTAASPTYVKTDLPQRLIDDWPVGVRSVTSAIATVSVQLPPTLSEDALRPLARSLLFNSSTGLGVLSALTGDEL